ncbi:MAG: GlsB/YeaQ/YmgE family stress response membrane protein [Pyrinomonadaceae bacterium]|nr:GlsB/YeaQ/YmgE family stress response membrane protein [Pyrinomonadaceae bacterium]MCX7639814.1 GlsB/YeaQ/YmgE family stress response membrane protein [Pyrinomonadaceae bacterium]MDW8304397.1 GlsB/YeaQ/YmgE family stress response membrane protein [Acidobacteriota bacterium]
MLMFEALVLLSWVVFGLIVGFVGHFLMRSRHTGSWKLSLILGAVGALIGGFLGRLLFGFGFKVPNSTEDLTIPSYILSLIFAVLGAIIFDSVYRIVIDRSKSEG